MAVSINQALKALYEQKEGEYEDFCSLHKGSSPFYYFVIFKFKEYLNNIIQMLNEDELYIALIETKELLGSNTKHRFVTLCEEICKHIRLILGNLYSPNHTVALMTFREIFRWQKYGFEKIFEWYVY